MYVVESRRPLTREQQDELHSRRQRFQLARVLRITETMLAQAQAGHWQEVEALEALRKDELDQCFDLQTEQPSLLIAEALATLVNLNDQIVELVRGARDGLAAEHLLHAGQMRAARTYTEVLS